MTGITRARQAEYVSLVDDYLSGNIPVHEIVLGFFRMRSADLDAETIRWEEILAAAPSVPTAWDELYSDLFWACEDVDASPALTSKDDEYTISEVEFRAKIEGIRERMARFYGI